MHSAQPSRIREVIVDYTYHNRKKRETTLSVSNIATNDAYVHLPTKFSQIGVKNYLVCTKLFQIQQCAVIDADSYILIRLFSSVILHI